MSRDAATDATGPARRYATTCWGLILSRTESGTSEEKAREALSQLCRIYWRPIFAGICGRGYSPEDAQDLTQEFFLMLLKGNLLSVATPERGRFRSLLQKSLENFLADQRDRKSAQKRGGAGEPHVSWDDWIAEAPSRLMLPAAMVEKWSPDRIFDVRWAATVAEQALRQLQEECEKRGRRRVFDALSGLLTAGREEVSYASLTRELGVTMPEIRRALHQLRLRYRQLLRAAVAETVEREDEVEAELHYLIAALGAATGHSTNFA